MKRFLLIAAFAVLCCLCTDVNAASMFGKVIDVNSGDVITIVNLNRPVRVKLVGVDAPEMDQAFGDVAKKHLSDLIHDKSVVVEYSGIAADGSVSGRVLLNDADIGAQMIRDGAAWFDPNNLSNLSGKDREIYQHSEKAARDERRGLWQAVNPTAPWEFVKIRALQKDPRPMVRAIAPAQKPARDRSPSELTNLTLMTRGAASAPGSPQTSANDKGFAWAEAIPTRSAWRQFRPEGEDFTALVPENGQLLDTEVPLGGEMNRVTLYLARDGWSTYFVQWLKAKSLGETHNAALSDAVLGFSMGLKVGLGPHANESCRASDEKYISVNGLPAVEFEMVSCVMRGRARIVTKLVDGHRYMYVLAAIFMNEDDNVPRFLNSLTLDPTPKTKTRRR
jgi:endonuclease YncB( thermonuclease family)